MREGRGIEEGREGVKEEREGRRGGKKEKEGGEGGRERGRGGKEEREELYNIHTNTLVIKRERQHVSVYCSPHIRESYHSTPDCHDTAAITLGVHLQVYSGLPWQ